MAIFLDYVLEKRLAGDAFDAVQLFGEWTEWLWPYGHLGVVLRLGACYGMELGDDRTFLGVERVRVCGCCRFELDVEGGVD